MRLSIITINLNNKIGLERTMDSVFKQDFKGFEFIVIDGASSDGSTALIHSNEGKIAYWVSEKDKGIYHAMNKGITVAKGDYCFFLNSGDYLIAPDSLTSLFSIIDAGGCKEGIISCNLRKIYDSGKWRRVSSPTYATFLAMIDQGLPHQATLISRQLFSIVGFYKENYKISADWDFFLKAILIHHIPYRHIDIDLSYFDLQGVSSQQSALQYSVKEVEMTLKEIYPEGWQEIMAYKLFWNSPTGSIMKLVQQNNKRFSQLNWFFAKIISFKKKIKGN